MQFITLTRPDRSLIAINVANILSIAEVPPAGSPLSGAPGATARITFANQTHQDVRETVQQVLDLIKAA
jgi:hypothetical protein